MESALVLEARVIRRIRSLPLWRPLAVRDFRLLWLGQSVSLFGDQFYLIALPWLALTLTGSALALGSVLMVFGGTRAAFQLLGGALSDLVSRRSLMLVSSVVRAVVTGLIALVVLFGITKLWHLFILSFIFGIVDAVFFPAFMSVIPSLVTTDHLRAGNALLRGTGRLMSLLGPAVAGLVVSTAGIAAAFAIDAATFVFVAVMIGLLRNTDGFSESSEPEAQPLHDPDPVSVDHQAARHHLKTLFASIVEGLRYAWAEPVVRALFLIICAIEFSYAGPAGVGLASLARNRFDGPGALGMMLSSIGGGMVIGMLLGGSIDGRRRRGPVIIVATVLMGLALSLLGFATSLVMACGLLLFSGIGAGLTNILIMAWIQAKTRSGMLGRVISVLMLGMSLTEPLSFALSGMVVSLNLKMVFVASGTFLLLASLIAITNPTLRSAD